MALLGTILELKLKPWPKFLLDVIEKISAKDVHDVFAEPVSETEVN